MCSYLSWSSSCTASDALPQPGWVPGKSLVSRDVGVETSHQSQSSHRNHSGEKGSSVLSESLRTPAEVASLLYVGTPPGIPGGRRGVSIALRWNQPALISGRLWGVWVSGCRFLLGRVVQSWMQGQFGIQVAVVHQRGKEGGALPWDTRCVYVCSA